MESNCRSKFHLPTPKASEVLWCALQLSSVPSTKRCQETWVARRYHQNVQRCIQETRLTNSPLIHIMCALWHLLDEIRAQHLRQHPVIHSAELHCTCRAAVTDTLQLLLLHPKDSFYGTKFFKIKAILNDILLLIFDNFCASNFRPHSRNQTHENLHILLK